MRRAIIVHCWGGNPNYAWYPRVQAELEKQGYAVTVPAMPDTHTPALSKWLPYLQQAIGAPDDELILVGHSLGVIAIMRYLESLPEGKAVGKVIFVAGFTDDLGIEELKNFFERPLAFDRIQPKSERGFVLIQSDNDPYVAAKYGPILRDELHAKLIIKHGAGHMSGAVDDTRSCTELPEVIENITGTA